ncbi:MAG: pseudouridine synthase [Acidimicrobiales bacterium]
MTEDPFSLPGLGEQPAGPERLQKLLARAGVASRRVVEEMISEGRISVNGQTATLGDKADAESDEISVDGAVISVIPDAVTYLLNKPAGTVSTADDPHGRPTVVDLVPHEPRVHPVGRLDLDTEGLLLLTNDGGMTHRLTHPSHGVEKEYLAHVEGSPKPLALRMLREGVDLDDGPTAPAQVALIGENMIRLTIHEGRNRQIRRMCEAVGHPVIRLVRTRIGPLVDHQLKPGAWRLLTVGEILALQKSVNRSAPRPKR